jgi:DNA-binding SARP family transcriptional activator/TolB-like protein/Tfp pilus assembly protein PilF
MAMWELRTLGQVAVLSAAGAPAVGAAAQRKPLALLALLATAGDQGLTRERLTAYLWPDLGEDRARQALRQLLYALRRDLAAPELFLDGPSIRLDPAILISDVAALAAARRAGDWQLVVELHQGVFLDGFYISEAGEFERWVEEERARIEQAYRNALERLAEAAAAAGEHHAATTWWRRLFDTDPLDDRVALALMGSLVSQGSPGLAIECARAHDARVREELGTGLDPRIARMAQAVRDEMTARGPTVTGPLAEAERSGPQPLSHVPATGRRRARMAGALSLAALAFAVIAGPTTMRTRHPTRPAPAIGLKASVAVLPLEDASLRAADRYIGLALAKELARSLALVASLRVVGPEVAARDTANAPPELARRLGVGALVEGATRLEGDRVNLVLRLIEPSSGRVLWSRNGEHKLADVPAELGQATRSIAGVLDARLSLRENGRLGGSPTNNVQAYRDYLRSTGLSPVSRVENEAGIEILHQVLQLDSTFALAYAALARRYVFQGFLVSPVYRDSGYAAATHAVALDPEMALAHVAVGDIEVLAGRPATACFSYLRALELSPNEIPALANLSDALSTVGRFDESLYWADRAVQIAPNVPQLHAHLVTPLYYMAADEAAADRLRAAEEQWPDFARLQIQRAYHEMNRGRDSLALAYARRTADTHPGDREAAVTLAQIAVLAGSAEAESLVTAQYRLSPDARPYGYTPESPRALLAFLRLRRGDSTTGRLLADTALRAALTAHAQGGEDPNPVVEVAALHAASGRSDQAIQWLRRASALGWKDYRFLIRDPFFAALRADARFTAIREEMESAVAVMRRRAHSSRPAVLSGN